jgi:hypothetical protein
VSLNSQGSSRIPVVASSTGTSNLLTPVGRIGAQSKVADSPCSFRKRKCEAPIIGIKRIVRLMRGGSQSRLVEGEDGHFYVAKFAGNPQGNRTLVNEWIAQSILSQLGISTPPLCVLRLPQKLRSEDLGFSVGDKRMPVEGEWHLGSLCPVNPEIKVIFDFLPVRLLENVSNLNDFAKVWVADRWLYHADTRQAVFVRDRGLVEGQIKFRAHFIDHGQTFSGSSWELRESSLHGLYVDRAVYLLTDMSEVCDQTMSQIESLTSEQVFSPLATLPSCWLSGDDQGKLSRLLDDLYQNRLKLRRIVPSQLTCLNLKRDNRLSDRKVSAGFATQRRGMGSAGHIGTSGVAGYGS